MSELIEVAFEGIPIAHLGEKLLGIDGQISSIEVLEMENPPNVDEKNIQTLERLFTTEKRLSAFLRFDELEVSTFLIHNCSLLIKKEKSHLYFVFIFDEDDFVLSLKDWALYMKEKLEATTTYCGLEPASDEDTRYFTS